MDNSEPAVTSQNGPRRNGLKCKKKNGTGKVETAASDTLSFSNDAYKMRTFLESDAEKIVFQI